MHAGSLRTGRYFRLFRNLSSFQNHKSRSMRVCQYRYLSLTNYADAHALQEEIHERRKNDDISDTLLLLEHRHVITLGRAANRANVLVDDKRRKELAVELFATGRGGDVTYHGPGQLVGYPIIKLAPERCDL